MDAPLGTREFQCGGQESALLDWRSSEEHLLTGQSCWTHLHLYKRICVTPDLLDSHCALLTTFWFLSRSCQVGGRSQSLCRNTGGETGRLETSSGHYRTLKEVAALCRGLDCGCSAVSVRRKEELPMRHAWWTRCSVSICPEGVFNITLLFLPPGSHLLGKSRRSQVMSVSSLYDV